MHRRSSRRLSAILAVFVGLLAAFAAPVGAHPDPGGEGNDPVLHVDDPADALEAIDALNSSNIISDGPNAKVTKNLDVTGRGVRNGADETTDVWAHDGFAYTGTFNDPCGGDPEAGIWVWDVHNKNKPSFVTVIQSPVGSRTNDVRVEAMNSGDILVLSNEACAAGGPGGFEIYDVADPANAVHLSSVRIDELNPISNALFGGLTDVGVHNLWLFTQGTSDYVAVTSEGAFDNFRIYDITDPTAPSLVSGWGAEELFDPGVGDETVDVGRVLAAALDLLSGFGVSQNKFLHDVTISDDGTHAYLANWDAGLVLLDISDPANPSVVSVAIDPINGSLDGEVNSHSVWPSDDGTIVVEGEEDFSAWEGTIPPTNLTLDGTVTPGSPMIPAAAVATDAGDFFQATPTGLTGTVDGSSVAVHGGPTFDAVELTAAPGGNTFTDTGPISGNLIWVGQACGILLGESVENGPVAGENNIAVVRRGACEFDDKAQTVEAAGFDAMVLANNQQSTPWSGLRIWDYSDPTNPVLASTFDTFCSASTAPSAECASNGTYSSHNVQLETRGNKTFAYVSWYWDGMLVLDVTDPYNPTEVARYLDPTGPNDGLANDFWGVFVEDAQSPWIYGADRNGGLYIFKLKGSGSGR